MHSPTPFKKKKNNKCRAGIVLLEQPKSEIGLPLHFFLFIVLLHFTIIDNRAEIPEMLQFC
jgi:hypothetical protein